MNPDLRISHIVQAAQMMFLLERSNPGLISLCVKVKGFSDRAIYQTCQLIIVTASFLNSASRFGVQLNFHVINHPALPSKTSPILETAIQCYKALLHLLCGYLSTWVKYRMFLNFSPNEGFRLFLLQGDCSLWFKNSNLFNFDKETFASKKVGLGFLGK
jgi:hypothetical protein